MVRKASILSPVMVDGQLCVRESSSSIPAIARDTYISERLCEMFACYQTSGMSSSEKGRLNIPRYRSQSARRQRRVKMIIHLHGEYSPG